LATAFDVKHQADSIVVTVQEGTVAVALTSPLNTWQVGSGYQFVYSMVAATTTLSSVDTSAVLAWREGRLEYVRAPLVAVIADVNRYAQRR